MTTWRIGLAAVTLFLGPRLVWATVTQIDLDFRPTVPNVMFDGETLTIQHSSILGGVTVVEDGPVSGFDNVSFYLTTTYESVLLTGEGFRGGFRGGSFSLMFDDGLNDYEFSGAVDDLILWIDNVAGEITPLTRLTGEFVFVPLVVDLPTNPTGLWAGTASRHAQFFTHDILVEQELTDLFWIAPTAWNSARTDGWSFINSVPEPATLLFLALGALALYLPRR